MLNEEFVMDCIHQIRKLSEKIAYFEIVGDRIIAREYLDYPTFGMHIGGRWCLDYYFKLLFNISNEDWNDRCMSLYTDDDFYDLCDKWLGVYVKRGDGFIYRKGKKYDEWGREICP